MVLQKGKQFHKLDIANNDPDVEEFYYSRQFGLL
jgi:hypothetical protein